MLAHFFFGFEIWANPVFTGEVSKTGAIFLGYAKGALFTPLQCNFQKLLRCNREENVQDGYTGGGVYM